MGVKICLGCMREIGDEDRCPYCGFSREDKVPQFALKPKTVLHNRYVVGKMLQTDGEGHTYIGYDCSKECAVFLREYMPGNLCSRQGSDVLVGVGCDAKYKALKSDFIDLYQHLGELNSLENITRVYDLFEENNTVYAVYLKYDAVPLNQYLNEQAGELSWKQASKLFKPVLESIAVIHGHGVIHRGISPETLMITPEGQLLITGFEICAARMFTSELETKIYEGYAAPEQYARMTPHGEWTDVYALCAVLYKVLSGTRPPEADTRSVNDNLIPLVELNDTVPRSVSDAVMKGMQYDYRNRTGNVRELVTELYHSGNFTIVMDAATMEHTRTLERARAEDAGVQPLQQEEEERRPVKDIAPWKKVLLLCLPFVLLIAFLLYWVMIGFGCQPKDDGAASSEVSSELSSEASETSSASSSEASDVSSEVSSEADADMVVVDQVVGMNINDVQGNAVYEDKFTIVIGSEEYSEDAEGTIIAQSLDAGTEVERFTELVLTVSLGQGDLESITISSQGELNQQTAEAVQNDLRNQGYTGTLEIKEEASDSVPEGNVTRVTINGQPCSYGSAIPISSIQSIEIYSSTGPAE